MADPVAFVVHESGTPFGSARRMTIDLGTANTRAAAAALACRARCATPTTRRGCLPDFSVTKASTTNETRETPVPKTPEAMRKMFDVHVPYEIIRLDEMYRLMAQPD